MDSLRVIQHSKFKDIHEGFLVLNQRDDAVAEIWINPLLDEDPYNKTKEAIEKLFNKEE